MSFIWNIEKLYTDNIENKNNVVIGIDYSVFLNDKTHVGNVQVSININSFIEFNLLNKNTVIEWVKSALGPDVISSIEITLQMPNTNNQVKTLPWSN